MSQAEFRKELVKIMPGYDWTIHKSGNPEIYLCATGVQSSGFNRLSTLQVERRERDGRVRYEVKSAGYGKRAPWLATAVDDTLARALRVLQNHYENMAATYRSHASYLQHARTPKEPPCAGTI
ncbi:hypothetical protein ET418_15235 [Oryzomonas rubra]|uniref:Uncharacterized protein n=1 Tax=Oryzomonas rubra TaxID=2509454 RepID=A0A5A9XAN7_9BACT|nr:hypothetical protein ET418_15235 [Oryzomonas rubra]